MKCPNCGKNIHDEASFCPYCMHKNGNIRVIKEKRKFNKTTILIIVEFIVILALGICVLVIARKDIPTKEKENVTYLTEGEETTAFIKNENQSATKETEVNKQFQEYLMDENICCHLPYSSYMLWEYEYEADKQLSFSVSKGVYYVIDLREQRIIDSSAQNARVIECSVNDGIVRAVVESDTIPYEVEYVVDVGTSPRYSLEYSFRNDVQDNYVVYSDGRIEFVSTNHNYYYLDYANSKLINSNIYSTILVDLSLNGNMLTVKLQDDGHGHTLIYSFDVSKNKVASETSIKGQQGLNSKDYVTQFEYNQVENAFVFDTLNGPLYKIALDDGRLLRCSSTETLSDGSLAKVVKYEKNNDVVLVTVVSGELPREMTYAFDISKCYKGY